ncbi:MAG TPA: hypothetical protein VFB72_14935, partial [Verrucomicrobiae bacterium]|nr:hypothetical protein [Verrucomicrobiae bacterium]
MPIRPVLGKVMAVKIRCMMLALTALLAGLGDGQAMWMRYETENVPIERVLTNFEKRLATNQNDVEALYHLARIHSMAYAEKSNWFTVRTNTLQPAFPFLSSGVPYHVVPAKDAQEKARAFNHLTNAIGYYQRASVLVFRGTNATNYQWLICPIHLGLAWSLEQAGHRDEAIKAYRKALVLAWDREVHDQPSIKEQVEWSWDQIRAKKNPLTKPPAHSSLGPGICYSQEIIGYLEKILDPVKDAKEIAQLKQDEQILKKMPRYITPILVSLQPNTPLSELVDPSANVTFDLDGTGLQRRWGWITPKAAWLVFDKNGSGRITSGLQMFGNVTFWIFWRNGYDALRALDDNGDGVLSGDELRGISVWEDSNGNGICEPGEVRPIT